MVRNGIRLRGWLLALAGLAALALPASALAESPSITTLPALGNKAVTVGDVLDGTPLAVAGTAPLTITYQWQSCNAMAVCADIVGATAATYTVTADQVNARLRVLISVANGELPDVVQQPSDSTDLVKAAAPRDSAPTITSGPTVTGIAAAGQTLTAIATADGVPQPTITYAWQRCDAGGAACQDAGVTSNTYQLTAADGGATFRAVATASNGVQPDAVSDPSAPAGPVTAPAHITAGPSIVGTTVIGQTLTATAAAVTGYPPPTVGYAWTRCNAGGSGCVPTATTGQSYTLGAADVGATLRVVAAAANDTGVDSSTSDASGVVGEPPSLGAVSVTGNSLTPGAQLHASVQASGTPSPSVSYSWSRCDANGNGCQPIGAGGANYTLQGADVGSTLRATATATNGIEPAATSTSAPSGLVGTPARLDGTPDFSPNSGLLPGVTLQANASVSGVPAPNVGYTWLRCSASSNTCTPTGGFAAQYTVTNDDVGSRIRLHVDVSNEHGSDSGNSPFHGPVNAPPTNPPPTSPPHLSTPTISGIAVVGQTLTAGVTVTGSPQPSLQYQWQRCDTSGNACADIAGAAGAQRVVVAADQGATLRVTVAASNSAGSDTQRSSPTGVVAATTAGGGAPTGTIFDTTVSGTGTNPPAIAAKGEKKPLSPFPQVRIRGKLVKGGAQVTLFSVTAPLKARISVRCTGKGCPKGYVANARHRVTRVGRYERFLRAGVKVTVRISRSGYIGKYSSFRIRDRKAPVRHDLCLSSPTSKPVRCVT
jgi:hypothetical protein